MVIVTRHQAGRKVNKDDYQHLGWCPKARRGTQICFLNVCVFVFSIKFSKIYSGLIMSPGKLHDRHPGVKKRSPHSWMGHLPPQARWAASMGPDVGWWPRPCMVLMAGPFVYKGYDIDPPGPSVTFTAEGRRKRGFSDACSEKGLRKNSGSDLESKLVITRLPIRG